MSPDGITTHDGAREYVRSLVGAWAPRWSVSTTSTRELDGRVEGVLALKGPEAEGHMEYRLPVEPGLLRRRAFAVVVGDRRVPDYMREARVGA